MQNIINSLAVLAFLGMIIALFALSALLRTVRELQQAALAASAQGSVTPGVRSVARFASTDGRPTFLLVVSEHCASCRERAERLAVVADGRVEGHLKMLSAGAACGTWVEGTKIEFIADSDLLGRVAIGATPSLVKYAPDGTEAWRRVVGSDNDLDQYLGAQSSDVANVR
ncbi:hypothetical protein [Nonomuraea basaltis]|uniref:hypothetical protein n=1 Tax=Nonomuraea basaltis TaxID=2495887 RepID=UPI00110C425B|nr:hypothetical protein [Nonomuraea basaltis]TMR93519.1 hypothetical protein EJK15_38920 [Nonomuraea basaltis]